MKATQSLLDLCRSAALFAISLVLLALPAGAKELTQPLTAEEVACNERQLEKLLLRMNAAKESYWPLPQLPTVLLVSYSNSVGFYDGLVTTFQGFRLDVGGTRPTEAYEHYLAFNINPSIRTLLLNPGRPTLPQVSLNREQSSSNLVPPGSYFELVLTLEPTLGDGERLEINNFEEPSEGLLYNGFLANSTKPGRGLTADGLLTPCHQKLTNFDRHVFSILQRMVRGGDASEFHNPDSEVAIFRGEDPHTYRINFYPIYLGLEGGPRMAAELKMDWTPEGKLTSAVLRALPACGVEGQTGCSVSNRGQIIVFLIRPVFGGQDLYSGEEDDDSIFYSWYQGPSDPEAVNLEALLARTTWNEPVW